MTMLKSSSLELLPKDILELIINFLDLRSISRLSRSSRSLLRLTRSESLWRRIAKALIGPWIHRSQLTAPAHPRPHSSHVKPPADWTLDNHCFPLSQFSRSTPCQASQELLITSWYQFVTRFLIPHAHFLGWHVSNIIPHGQLILVTYDVSSGRLVAEEIKCQNLYSTKFNTSFIHPFSLNRSESSSQSPHSTQTPVWPSWLPSNHVRVDSSGVQYSLTPGLDLPDSGYSFDIFAPVYVSSPLFSVFPFEPHYRLACVPTSYQQITIQKPKLIIKSWEALTLDKHLTPLSHPTQIIAPRSDISSCELLSQDYKDDDFPINARADAKEFHSLTLASTPEGFASRVDIAANEDDGRIRYQGGPRQQQVRTSSILLGGRTYTTNGAGLLRPVVHFPIWSIEYYPLDGPTPYSSCLPTATTLEGLWVGCYGSHGTEFGKIILDPPSTSSSNYVISFVKLTGDPNIPAGQVSWKVSCDALESIHPVSLSEAISIDLGLSQADGGWLKGQGQVANTNYEEPGWINAHVQLISGDHDALANERKEAGQHPPSQIEQIRVKWIELGRVSTFFKVAFR